MLCKVSSKNQITLPKEIMAAFQNRDYFDARVERGRIVLEPMIVRPVESPELARIRDHVEQAGLDESIVDQLVAEAKRARRP
jgi:bifunctional DNA-binding transcriptional regulator/antitoxin component of YhaV-PrlF toxin-antitoxin module